MSSQMVDGFTMMNPMGSNPHSEMVRSLQSPFGPPWLCRPLVGSGILNIHGSSNQDPPQLVQKKRSLGEGICMASLEGLVKGFAIIKCNQ